ncbi:TPR domain protein, putative component of TonB system [Alloactinosynnema sp. L-07]|uniref:tetratricopeptide repeat protein n=1 Tax=Alloactinosynnema sp. L-07 TaxID=1653480 RepID=UPI00065EF6C0|nr:hypothetical protein [Alloactinosynnema sp. L-07]CRK59343.1 TPR domain protein, putative component of TonB system [Alloactinosynnema sp. L-07]
MLSCSHHREAARGVRGAARRGRFPEALDLGLALLTRHPNADVCGCRFAADLLPLANAAELPGLGEPLFDVVAAIEGAGTLTGKIRSLTRASALSSARNPAEELDETDFDLVRTRWLPGRHHRIAVVELRLRRGEHDTDVTVARKLGKGVLRRTGRARALHAAVGCGLALLEHGRPDDGHALLRAAARALERDRRVRALVKQPDPPPTRSVVAATSRWAWARAVIALSDVDSEEPLAVARLSAAADYFMSVGYPLGAAEANVGLAVVHAARGDKEATVRAAKAALSFVERRFAAIGDDTLVARWRAAAWRARDLGRSAATDQADVRLFFDYDGGYDWLGARAEIDGGLDASAEPLRSLFRDPHTGTTYSDMLRRAMRLLVHAGTGGPLARELVARERGNLAAGGDGVWLGRALACLAELHVRRGDVTPAIAAAREAREVMHALERPEARAEADHELQVLLDLLLDQGHWAQALRLAVAFRAVDPARYDPLDVVRTRAARRNRPDVAEEVAACSVELARARAREDGDAEPVAQALWSWGIARDAVRAGSGAPAFAEAVEVAEALVADGSGRHLGTVVRARTELALHQERTARPGGARIGLNRLWVEVCVDGEIALDHVGALIGLVEAVIGVHTSARTKVDVLVPAAGRLLALLVDAGERPSEWAVRKLIGWTEALRELGAAAEAAELGVGVVGLRGLEVGEQVTARVELATTLRELDDLAGARRWADEAVELDPASLSALWASGLLHLDAGEPAAACGVLDRAVELELRGWAFGLRGLANLRLDRVDAAIEDLEVAVRLLPDSVMAVATAARAYRRAGAPEWALAVLAGRGAATSSDPWLRYQFGLAVAEIEGSAEAGQYFRDAWELGSAPVETVGAYWRRADPSLGMFLLALGAEDEAVAEFERVAQAGMRRGLVRELAEDLAELAGALPERAEGAARLVALLPGGDGV